MSSNEAKPFDTANFFSEYAPAAVFFSYQDGQAKIVMVNNRYFSETRQEKGMDSIVHSDPLARYDENDRQRFEQAILRAIETGKEQTLDVWREYFSACCGLDKLCLRVRVSLVSKSADGCLLVAQLENVTDEVMELQRITASEAKFRMAAEQANVYAWEYNIETKEMRPCVRCMRDLGFPPVLANYPEPVIENGLFPADYADMYRDWHRQIAEGVSSLEAVIPLTADRIPFLVRYTTEFDAKGKPIKAYGSATLVVEPKDKLAELTGLLKNLSELAQSAPEEKRTALLGKAAELLDLLEAVKE